MNWLDLAAVALAAGCPIDAWLHSGGIFSHWREWVAVWGEPPAAGGSSSWPTRRELVRARIAQLLSCRFCLSHHTPWIILLLFYVPSLWLASPWDIICKLPIYSMAATRLTLMLEVLNRDGTTDQLDRI